MKTPDREPIFSNDADIVILDESEGVTNTTRRPATGASLKMAMEYLQKETVWQQQQEDTKKVNTEVVRAQQKESPESNLEQRFDDAMMDIYRRAKSEVKYNASRYFQMLTEHRGVGTARILLHSDTVSEGYTALWERGRLDLTVEALIYEHSEYHSLFTDEERGIARRRLEDYKYPPVVGKRK